MLAVEPDPTSREFRMGVSFPGEFEQKLTGGTSAESRDELGLWRRPTSGFHRLIEGSEESSNQQARNDPGPDDLIELRLSSFLRPSRALSTEV